MTFSLHRRLAGVLMLIGVIAVSLPAMASSHREALAILNEPCADNTDTFAWVSPGDHSKLYLIMDFNPLHEPGQGNQGLRACDVYRIEFHKSITPAPAPKPTDSVGGGNELLWQLTGGTETMTVTRVVAPGQP